MSRASRDMSTLFAELRLEFRFPGAAFERLDPSSISIAFLVPALERNVECSSAKRESLNP